MILVRDAPDGLELLLVQRGPAQRVMAGFWVFPGGVLDDGEEHRAAAVRELSEEAGVGGIEPAALVAYSRWITPELIERRFDTRFFLALAPHGVQPRVDGQECVDVRWSTPRAALDGYARGELALAFPTLRQLEELAPFATVDELFADAGAREVLPIMPRVVLAGDTSHVLLPGEPGYDE